MQRSAQASIVTLKTEERVFKNGCHGSLCSSEATEYVPPKIWMEMEKESLQLLFTLSLASGETIALKSKYEKSNQISKNHQHF